MLLTNFIYDSPVFIADNYKNKFYIVRDMARNAYPKEFVDFILVNIYDINKSLIIEVDKDGQIVTEKVISINVNYLIQIIKYCGDADFELLGLLLRRHKSFLVDDLVIKYLISRNLHSVSVHYRFHSALVMSILLGPSSFRVEFDLRNKM